jgi:hypothetical protein
MKKKKKKAKAAGKVAEVSTGLTIDSGDADAKAARAQKRDDRRRAVNQDLQMEIATLRQTLTEIIDRYRLKLDAELVQVADASGGNGALGEPPRQLSASVAASMLKQIRGLELKPQKGRAKDLQRVQALVDNLIEQLPAEK